MRNTVIAAVCTILIAVMASGCGWRLRGTGVVPAGIDSMHISARDMRSELVRELSRTLRAADVSVLENATDAEYSLVVLNETGSQRTATVNASARISELQLTEEVEFLVLNSNGKPLLPATRLSVERVFEYNEDNVLATNDEKALLRKEMRRELVRQMLNRMRQIEVTPTAAKDAPAP